MRKKTSVELVMVGEKLILKEVSILQSKPKGTKALTKERKKSFHQNEKEASEKEVYKNTAFFDTSGRQRRGTRKAIIAGRKLNATKVSCFSHFIVRKKQAPQEQAKKNAKIILEKAIIEKVLSEKQKERMEKKARHDEIQELIAKICG